MSLLADDFFDNWVDWKIELYSTIANFALDPSVEHHDAVVKVLKEQAGDEVRLLKFPNEYPSHSTPVIAICNDKRKRDALAIMGPDPDIHRGRGYNPHVKTWKCSKHTPQAMRGQWVSRKYSWSGSGLYICKSTKFVAEHEVYAIPKEVYEALTTQFKHIAR